MKILMFTNTYFPRLGGVTQSIALLRKELIKGGHSVLIVTSRLPEVAHQEDDVLRVPVLARTSCADLPFPIMSMRVRREIHAFGPDIVHAHHPFLLGRTALHTAAWFDIPIVYTFHTRYDLYVRALGGGIWLEKLIRRSMMAFCQTADAVIAPSDSIRCMLKSSGLATPVVTIPTGINAGRVSGGDRSRMRKSLGLKPDAFVIGHIGRLEAEKNLAFLASAVAIFLRNSPTAVFLIGGDGTQKCAMTEKLSGSGVADRVIFAGSLKGRAIADALSAMDIFVFASLTETQGLVVTEAQAAGLPVIALDAPGVHEAVTRGGGFLLDSQAKPAAFADALQSFERLTQPDKDLLRKQAFDSAARHSSRKMAVSIEDLYGRLIAEYLPSSPRGAWRARITKELKLFKSMMSPIDTMAGSRKST
ncbi:MAG: glycosyltransferase [Marivita sp.]|uniref:glycosyltransferase n=1 Tax=Marivita sp. TaxID=2003365 RepID=UPI003EF4CEC9